MQFFFVHNILRDFFHIFFYSENILHLSLLGLDVVFIRWKEIPQKIIFLLNVYKYVIFLYSSSPFYSIFTFALCVLLFIIQLNHFVLHTCVVCSVYYVNVFIFIIRTMSRQTDYEWLQKYCVWNISVFIFRFGNKKRRSILYNNISLNSSSYSNNKNREKKFIWKGIDG